MEFLMKTIKNSERISTGIPNLDEILNGGLIPNRSYLIHGGPGTGKTTLGLHFLLEGSANKEKVLYITLEDSEANIKENNKIRSMDFSGISFLDISPTSDFFTEVESYDIFSPAEVERVPLTKKIVEQVNKIKPTRVFIDPITQLRYLNSDVYQYRKQTLSFLRFLVEQGATVMFTSESSKEAPDEDLQFMSDGVINIIRDKDGRYIEVEKSRGTSFQGGKHAIKIDADGIKVFPRLIPNVQRSEYEFEMISSGIPTFDEMLNGGIERGTVTILSGPSGSGKTTLGLQFMKEAAGRGERSVVYAFEEEKELMLQRCDCVNIPARKMVEHGKLDIKKVEPLQYSTDEFAYIVRKDVEENNTRIVMIDSISGYKLSLRGDDLQSRLHALGKYLQNLGVTVIIVNEVEYITGDFRLTEEGISHLADNIIYLRYLELNGKLIKAIGVLKKRLSEFEKTLRELEITKFGIKIGQPFKNMRGILKGIPELNEDKHENPS